MFSGRKCKKRVNSLAICAAYCYNDNMKSVDLNANWNIVVGDARYDCDLPHDAAVGLSRDYACAFGQLNGIYRLRALCFRVPCRRLKAETPRSNFRACAVWATCL